ncbi:MAG TPA: glycosyltransferase family 39 protein [Burkholderiales bacterium]
MPPRLPSLALPLPAAALALIAFLFVLPGIGHDLWKSHDALGLGIVHGMATSGDLLVPRVSGLLWMYDPPLFHWVALGFGRALDSLIAFHAAARLASAAFVLLAFWLIYAAARRWAPEGEGRTAAAAAVLLLLGSVGLMVHAHEALPELAALAALCTALAALPYAIRRPVSAGTVHGAALGLAFLSSGWVAPASLAAATLACALVSPQWRQRRGGAFLVAALVAALLVGLSWPIALALASPNAFLEWWTLAVQSEGSPFAQLRYLLVTASWFAWPAWPLALWALWSLRRRWREPRIFVPACATLLMLAAHTWSGGARDVDLIPVLAPLALLGAQAVLTLRRGAAAALDWFAVLAFAFFVALLWLGYAAMMTGVPPKIASNLARAAPGFVPQFELLPFLAALALLLGWLYVALYTAPSALRAPARWATGIVLLWGTVSLLLMPWVEHQKSYRSVALQLRSKVPVSAGCIAAKSLGVPQSAALDYHGGIRTQAFDALKPRECPLILVQGNPRDEFDAPGVGWSKLADVGRPGDKSERYRLYAADK